MSASPAFEDGGARGSESVPAEQADVESRRRARENAAELEQVLFEVKRVVVGQDRMVERMLVCLLARGHCLLEGVPGVAKTLSVSTLAQAIGGTFARLQFTPDLVPSDVVGTRVYRMGREQFDVELGPVFANFVLADEINRAPAKVQSALLEVMAERQVTPRRHELPGADPVPGAGHAEPDRVRGRLPAPRGAARPVPDAGSGAVPDAVGRAGDRAPDGLAPAARIQVLSLADLLLLQGARDVFVHHAVAEYAVRLVLATREPVRFGVPEITGDAGLRRITARQASA